MTGNTTQPGQPPGTRHTSLLPEVLLTPVAAAALLLSATGLWQYAGHTLHLTGGSQLITVVGIDAAIFVCALLARRNKLEIGTRGAYGLMMWALAAVSALLASLEAATLEGQIGRAAFPFIAAALWELLTSYRHRETRHGPNRHVGMVRWLHPVERVRVMLELATDAGMSEVDATHRVRVRAAAWRLHRLSQLPDKGLRYRVANRRAGRALSRAETSSAANHRAVVTEVYEIASARRVARDTVNAARTATTVTPAQVFDHASVNAADHTPADPGATDGQHAGSIDGHTAADATGRDGQTALVGPPRDQADHAVSADGQHAGGTGGHSSPADGHTGAGRFSDRNTGRDGQRRSRTLPDPTKHMGSAWEAHDRLTAEGRRVNRDTIGAEIGVSNTEMRRAIWGRIKAGDRIVAPEAAELAQLPDREPVTHANGSPDAP